MHRRCEAALLRRIAGSVLAWALVLTAVALPAAAAEVVDVRVGSHPEFTRVVFELDRSAGYRVERAGTAKAPQLRVTLDAGSRVARKASAHGDVRGVAISSGARAVATIPLRRSDLRLQEMMLSDPPRIVLDLRRPEPVAVSKPAPKPVAVKKPAPAPVARIPEPKPEPAPVVKAPAPAPAPKPQVAVVETPTEPAGDESASRARIAVPLAEEPEPVELAELAEDTAADPEPEPEPAPDADTDSDLEAEGEPEADAESELDTEVAVRPESAEAMAESYPTPEDLGLGPELSSDLDDELAALEESEVLAEQSEPADPTEESPAQSEEPGLLAKLGTDPLWLGSLAGGLVALVGIAITLRRRRSVLPADLDVQAISAELDAEGDGAAAAQAEESPFKGLFDDDAAEGGGVPRQRRLPGCQPDGYCAVLHQPRVRCRGARRKRGGVRLHLRRRLTGRRSDEPGHGPSRRPEPRTAAHGRRRHAEWRARWRRRSDARSPRAPHPGSGGPSR